VDKVLKVVKGLKDQQVLKVVQELKVVLDQQVLRVLRVK
jgi:hypothetical protein